MRVDRTKQHAVMSVNSQVDNEFFIWNGFECNDKKKSSLNFFKLLKKINPNWSLSGTIIINERLQNSAEKQLVLFDIFIIFFSRCDLWYCSTCFTFNSKWIGSIQFPSNLFSFFARLYSLPMLYCLFASFAFPLLK